MTTGRPTKTSVVSAAIRQRTPQGTAPTARTSALYRDLTKLLQRLIAVDPALRARIAVDPALRARIVGAPRQGPAATIDTLEEMSDMHDGLRDGIVIFVLNHVDYDALAARLGA